MGCIPHLRFVCGRDGRTGVVSATAGHANPFPPGFAYVNDGQAYQPIGLETHIKVDGTSVPLIRWSASCATCSREFVTRSPLRFKELNRRCEGCKQPGRPVWAERRANLAKAGGTVEAERRANRAKADRIDKNRDALLTALGTGPTTAARLFKTTGLSRSKTYRLIGFLIEAGEVYRSPDGHYIRADDPLA